MFALLNFCIPIGYGVMWDDHWRYPKEEQVQHQWSLGVVQDESKEEGANVHSTLLYDSNANNVPHSQDWHFEKWNRHFKWVSIGQDFFFAFLQGDKKIVSSFEDSWSSLWRVKNNKFKDFLKGDLDLSRLFCKIFHL